MLEEEPVLQTDRNQIRSQGHVSLPSDVPLFAHEQFHWMVSQIAIPTSEQEQELVEQVDKALLVVENPVDYLLGVAKREIFVYCRQHRSLISNRSACRLSDPVYRVSSLDAPLRREQEARVYS